MAGIFSCLYLTLFGAGEALACKCWPYSAPWWVDTAETIIDGVVVRRDPIKGDFSDGARKTATLRVEKVWKGDAVSFVTLIFYEDTGACGSVPPLNEKIRFRSSDASTSDVWFGACDGMPLDDPATNRLLAEYEANTIEIEQRTASAGREGRLEFAAYLLKNNENQRALGIYQSLAARDPTDIDALLGAANVELSRDNVKEAEALIARARVVAPMSDAARGNIARMEFMVSGEIDPAWKDWSNLELTSNCGGLWLNLDEASFDHTDLKGCTFFGASLKGASFKGANLEKADIRKANLSGARFDCATKFPADFDPIAVGMSNVDGNCDATP